MAAIEQANDINMKAVFPKLICKYVLFNQSLTTVILS